MMNNTLMNLDLMFFCLVQVIDYNNILQYNNTISQVYFYTIFQVSSSNKIVITPMNLYNLDFYFQFFYMANWNSFLLSKSIFTWRYPTSLMNGTNYYFIYINIAAVSNVSYNLIHFDRFNINLDQFYAISSNIPNLIKLIK